MKNQRISAITAKLLTGLLAASLMIGGLTMEAAAESTGQVTVDNAKVRSDASTDSSTVSTLANGTTVTVTDEKSDSAGNIWYHVSLSDGTTGYVRSDLMTVTASVTETADVEAVADGDASGMDAFGAADMTGGVDVSIITNPDDVTAQDLQNATINVSVGKVRSNASTNDDIVAQLTQGTNVVISGSKLGSDSKTWYFVSFLDAGVQKTGYVRSDLVDMGDVIVLAFDQPVEEPVEPVIDEAPVPEVNNDYELVYTDDGTGNNVWWLYNHIDNTREKLQELLDYADSQANKTASLTSANQKLKIVSIVLGALLAVAVIAIIILAIKLGSGGYEYDDDDDEDEDDEEEEEEPVRRRDRRNVEAARARERERAARRKAEYEDDDDDDDDDVRTEAPAKKAKPKNFMLDDDDFEFEFLNMDDK
ncbi:SH3 domain-containing protein [Lachnospiraceae bacterium XBB2008]|nr:SH3 domain-containing protein [Lachnospiraceae bacterium XBB2008]